MYTIRIHGSRSPVGGRGPHASVNLDAQVVVDGMAKLLLTAKVSLCSLDAAGNGCAQDGDQDEDS